MNTEQNGDCATRRKRHLSVTTVSGRLRSLSSIRGFPEPHSLRTTRSRKVS